jgi:hypothetical protein
MCETLLLPATLFNVWDTAAACYSPAVSVRTDTLNVTKFYSLPTEYLCMYFVCISENNNEIFPIQHYLIGFYNWGEKCLLRGTDWVLK